MKSKKTAVSSKAATEVKSMQSALKEVTFGNLIVDESFRYRSFNPDFVVRYFETLRTGGTLPPIQIRMKDGKPILINGLHRVKAYVKYTTCPKEAGGLGITDENLAVIPCECLGEYTERQALTETILLDMKTGLAPTKDEIKTRMRLLWVKYGGEDTPEDERLTQAQLSVMFRIHQSNVSRIVAPPVKKDPKKKDAKKKDEPTDTRQPRQPINADGLERISDMILNREESSDEKPQHEKSVADSFILMYRLIASLTDKAKRNVILDHLQKYPAVNVNLSVVIGDLTELALQSKAITTITLSKGKGKNDVKQSVVKV